MQYVNLGNTGLKVSRLCLGMMTYGSKKWREWVLEEKEAKPFVKHALDKGGSGGHIGGRFTPRQIHVRVPRGDLSRDLR